MDEPRRRGRPRGSKNRPKPPANEPDLTKPFDFGPGIEIQQPYGLTEATVIPIHVSYQGAFGPEKTWEEDTEWPGNWPLPQQGQRIKLHDGRGGMVSTLTFNIALQRIDISLT